jgi:Na+/H+-translocating membrane pyrophosphatase
MTDKPDSDWKTKAALAAGAAVGSAAVAAALLFANKRRKDKAEGKPPATGKAPHYPPETD